jgi:two-component system response regulator MprA
MKNILITGKNSYIGTSLENWLMREPDQYKVDTVDMKDGSWKEKDFSQYDVVFHVAGIAHIKETSDNQDFYYKVNRDLVLLDVLMPVMDGWEVCRRLRSASPGLPVLMLTARDEVADRVKGLDLGADDYLVKPFALEELLARVRALLRRKGEQDTNGRALVYGDLRLDHLTREVRRGQREIQLTVKEFGLLSLFMEHPRQVLTRDTIMDRVWGIDYFGESNVLEVYVGMLRQKLEEGGESRLIHTVRGVGYVFK